MKALSSVLCLSVLSIALWFALGCLAPDGAGPPVAPAQAASVPARAADTSGLLTQVLQSSPEVSAPPKRNAPCGCADSCRCVAGECGSPECAALRDEDAYARAYRQAQARGVPLVLWIAEVCPACEQEMNGCVHGRLARWEDDTTPRAVIARKVGGRLCEIGQLPGIPTVEQIQRLLSRPTFAPQTFQPAFQPVFFSNPGGC
jgi:hypothetical protein